MSDDRTGTGSPEGTTEKAVQQQQTVEWTEEVAKKKGAKYQVADIKRILRSCCSPPFESPARAPHSLFITKGYQKSFLKISFPESIKPLYCQAERVFQYPRDAKRETTMHRVNPFSRYSITLITNSLAEISICVKRRKDKKEEREKKGGKPLPSAVLSLPGRV